MALSRAWLWVGTGVLAINLRLLFYIAQAYRRRRHHQKALKAFPSPPAHWLLGVMPQFKNGARVLSLTTEWTNKYKDGFIMWLSFSWCNLRCISPETVQAVLGTAEPKDPSTYHFIETWIGDGLLISKGKKWARNRRLLTPAFHFDILKPYVTTFSQSTEIMLDKWAQEAEKSGAASMEMFDNVSLMTLDSLMKCIFGVHDQDIQTQGRKHPYIQSVYRIAELVVQRFRFFPYRFDALYALTPAGFQMRRQINISHKFTRDVIDSKKDRDLAKNDSKYVSFLDILLDCKDADGQGLSYQEICDEVDTFMFEGHDTTASGISWFLYNLASHPDIQQKCREEVMRVLGDRTEVEWSDIPKFEYLTQCLKESLRLHPPVPAIARVLTKPLTFPDGRTIPEGTTTVVAIYNCHHNKHVWKDPDVYDPERFSAENSKDRHPHAFIPFAAGPRNCIGQHFAYNEMKTCAAQVLRRFRLAMDEKKPAPVPEPEITLRAKGGIWLRCTPI